MVEQGNHDQLINNGGKYEALVKNQIYTELKEEYPENFEPDLMDER